MITTTRIVENILPDLELRVQFNIKHSTVHTHSLLSDHVL